MTKEVHMPSDTPPAPDDQHLRPCDADGHVQHVFTVTVTTRDDEDCGLVTADDVAYAVADEFQAKHVKEVRVVDLHDKEAASAVPD